MNAGPDPLNLYRTHEVEAWDQLRERLKDGSLDLSAYVYRGQASATWPLATSLERTLRRLRVEQEYWVSDEYWLLYEFQKRAHLYEHSLPHKDDTLSWLALMQHHGAPTRLLDFTYS